MLHYHCCNFSLKPMVYGVNVMSVTKVLCGLAVYRTNTSKALRLTERGVTVKQGRGAIPAWIRGWGGWGKRKKRGWWRGWGWELGSFSKSKRKMYISHTYMSVKCSGLQTRNFHYCFFLYFFIQYSYFFLHFCKFPS